MSLGTRLTLPVERIMSRRVVMVFEGVPMAEVRALVATYDYNSVPVVTREGLLVGLVSKGDLLRAVRASFGAPEVWEQPVSRWMARRVVTLRPKDSLEAAITLMVEAGVRSLPVVDEDGRVVGMVSRTDLVRALEGWLPAA